MFTGGVGALIDLPNFPVLVRGLDEWRYDTVPEWAPLTEPRLLAAVGKLLSAPVKQLRPPPWLDGSGRLNGQACRVGVPVTPFPQWLRCTACNRLAPLDSRPPGGSSTTRPAGRTRRSSSTRTARGARGSRSPSPRGSCWPASTGTWTTSPTASSCTGAAPAPRSATRRC